MAQAEAEPHYNRRDFLIGGGLLVAGVALGATVDRLYLNSQESDVPLSPEAAGTDSSVIIEWLPNTVSRWNQTIEKYSKQYDVDPNLPAIIMTIESGGNPKADSGVAKGLMQITDPRAQDIAAKFLQEPRKKYNLYNPSTSIEFGVANIKHLIDAYGQADQGPSWDRTVGLVAAGYFGGEGMADVYRDKGLKALPQGTYNYVRYVTTMWRERHDNKSFAFRYWYDQANGKALVDSAR